MPGAEVFISYKSERRKAAEHLATVLELHDYSVWFDYQLIKGSDFGLQIDRRIRQAKAVVALWCSRSVGSRWVTEEADLAHGLGILIPVKIEPCELPVGFRRQDYIDLSSWNGAPRSPEIDPLLDALEQRIGRGPHLDLNGTRKYEATWSRFGAPSLKTFALGEPLVEVEGDRHLPRVGTAKTMAPAAWYEFEVLAAHEWPRVRESADPERLRRFEHHFSGTFYAEEARLLRERIVAGRIPVLVDSRNNGTRWLSPGAGEPFCDVEGGPEMVVVPAGRFMMGSPMDEPERFADEGPQREVAFTDPFAIGRHAVTRGQFAAFANATGHKAARRWRDPGFRQDDSHPAVFISWDDAKAYAAWLADTTGRPYRLPTEVEWEYAARAGRTTPFWWGSSITPTQANYNGNHVYKGGGSEGEYRAGTVPVGSFDANPWGLYNVHGNVWEWCEGAVKSSRVVRGGSWSTYPRYLRAAARLRNPTECNNNFGFRVARTLIS
jgi:formylglycine-generating enzyme required for sulfatase activity